MVVLIILIVILLLVFAVPYGVDVSYESDTLCLGVKAGPLRIRLLPQKPKTAKQMERQDRKKQKKKARQEARAAKKEADKA